MPYNFVADSFHRKYSKHTDMSNNRLSAVKFVKPSCNGMYTYHLEV